LRLAIVSILNHPSGWRRRQRDRFAGRGNVSHQCNDCQNQVLYTNSFGIGNLNIEAFVCRFDIYNGTRYNVTHDTVIPRSWHRGHF
jgi:hypothetical protein